jgi:uncharacterized protein
MAPYLPALFACLLMQPLVAQPDADAWERSLEAYWAEKEATFRDSATSPLLPSDRLAFQHLERFGPDPSYRVTARFKAREGPEFGMPTTTDRRPVYRSVGTLTFRLNGRRQRLHVYRNRDLTQRPEYANHLFVPFTDASNGVSTYGGGRYIDLEGPLAAEVELDLNRAYNPYCAYGGRYSCPIPPPENHLELVVEAGEKAFEH